MSMKKMAAGLSALLVGLALTACGGTTPPASPTAPAETTTAGDQPTTTDSPKTESPEAPAEVTGEVSLWMYPVIADEAANQKFWDEQKQKFEAKHPGAKLNFELRPWANRDEQLATAIAAGQGPDLVYLIPDQLGQYAATDGIVAIDDLAKPVIGDVRESAVNAATIDGKLYGLPILQTSVVNAYNKAMFTEAGITELPKTWDDIRAAAPKLAEKGHATLAYYGADTLNLSFYPLLWQAGGTIFTEDGKDVAFNSPEGVAALQFLVDLNGMKGLPADAAIAANDGKSDFLANKVAAMTYTLEESRIADIEAGVGAGNLEVGGVLAGKEQATYGAVGMLSRTSVRDNDAVVAAALEFFGSAEFSTELNTVAKRLPARTDVTLPGTNQVFIDALDKVVAGEPNQYARQVQGVLAPHVQAALQGSVTPQQALDAAADEARGMMG